MKRKLPQWLLDATNQNDKRSDSMQLNSDRISKLSPVQSDQITNTGTISVVPLANLLPSSHGGTPSNETHTSNERPMDEDVQRPTRPSSIETVIKEEIIDPTESSSTPNATNDQVVVKQEVKLEPVDTTSTSSVTTSRPDIKPERRSCNFGIKCFRRNPQHRTELAHPGDVDYRRPNLPDAPTGTPPCPWGAACYRRNPQHFIQLSHPPASVYNPTANTTAMVNVNTMPQSNTGNNAPPQLNPSQRRNRNSRMVVNDDDGDDDDEYDFEDPFIDNGSSDEYVPEVESDDDDDDDDDTEKLTEN